MAAKKQPAKAEKNSASKQQTIEKLREQHPFETDSQIQNRYGEGRKKAGSDGSQQEGRGSNH